MKTGVKENADTNVKPFESLLSDWAGRMVEHFDSVSTIKTNEEFSLPSKDVLLPGDLMQFIEEYRQKTKWLLS
jgi:hypothetical protein